MKSAFHAYASDNSQHYTCYDRSKAFPADIVEFDTTGEFDAVNHCFTANAPRIMEFRFHMLFGNVPIYTYLTPLLFIKRAGQSQYKELAGEDLCVQDCGGTPLPQGHMIARLVQLQTGDSVQARPCYAGSPAFLTLVQGTNAGENTCNYFEGFEVGGN